MSDTQQVWMTIWNRMTLDPQPFEIDDVVPEIAALLEIPPENASRLTAGFLKELDRMPEGRQFFAVEGNAVVSLPEFLAAAKDARSALDAYPFEL